MKLPEENSAKETAEARINKLVEKNAYRSSVSGFKDSVDIEWAKETILKEVDKATVELREALKDIIPIAEEYKQSKLAWDKIRTFDENEKYKEQAAKIQIVLDRAKKLIKD